MFEFASQGKPNIYVPALLIDTVTRTIIKTNTIYQNTYLLESQNKQQELIDFVISNLKNLESLSASYKLPTLSGEIETMIWAQYTDKTKNHILILLNFKSFETLCPIDYYIIADLIPEGVAYISLNENSYTLTYANQQFIKILGFEESEKDFLIGHSFSKYISSDGLLYLEQLRISSDYNERFTFSTNLICKNGALIQTRILGKFIFPSKNTQSIIITISPIVDIQLLHKYDTPRLSIMDQPNSMVFRYDFYSNIISFFGELLKKIYDKRQISYNINELYKNKHILKFNGSKLKKAISYAKKGKQETYVFKLETQNCKIYWVKVNYDFVYNSEGEKVAIVGRIFDVSEQEAAKEYYDKAISLFHIKSSNCQSIITLNVSEQTIIDGYSSLIPIEKLYNLSLSEYLDIISPHILNKSERLSFCRQMTYENLTKLAREQKKQFSYEFEIEHCDIHYWVKLDVSLIQNPKTGDLMAFLKWTNINNIKLQQKINELLWAKKFDFICLIFAKTDSYSMILNSENTTLLPVSMVKGYEAFVKNIIRQYSIPEDMEYLNHCFSLKNIKKQLSNNSSYSFIGHGLYPDNSPTVKHHTFQYLNEKQQIILYTREDFTNKSEVLTFKSNSYIYRIPFEEIIYIESFGKKSRIYTTSKTFDVNEMISSLQSRLPGRIFTRCHRCYIVRINSIKEINQKEAILFNGNKIPISQKKLSSFKDQFFLK